MSSGFGFVNGIFLNEILHLMISFLPNALGSPVLARNFTNDLIKP